MAIFTLGCLITFAGFVLDSLKIGFVGSLMGLAALIGVGRTIKDMTK